MIKNFKNWKRSLSKIKHLVFYKRYIDIHITDHCNLNCRGCAHFSPIADTYCMSMEEMEDTCLKLSPIFDRYFNSIHLLGGEPLLHPQVTNLLDIVRKHFTKAEIQLVTNGIKLLSMPDSFWETCKKEKIKIYISAYPAGIDYDRIRHIVESHGIAYELSELRCDFIHHVYDPKGKQNPSDSYTHCEFGGLCLQLRHGKLFPCARAAYMPIFNKAFGTHYQYRKGDYIEIDQLKHRWQFIRFVTHPIPFCRYCNMADEHRTEWGRSEKSIQEWM